MRLDWLKLILPMSPLGSPVTIRREAYPFSVGPVLFMKRFIQMFGCHETGRETPGNGLDQREGRSTAVQTRYKIVIGLLLLSLVIASLVSLQHANLLQVQNNQLLSHSSSLDQQNSGLNKILALKDSYLLADQVVGNWPPGTASFLVQESCSCFQYSGYLHVTWNSAANLTFQVVQFRLTIRTLSVQDGDFRISVSSLESFSMAFVIDGCPISGCPQGQVTFTVVYHY